MRIVRVSHLFYPDIASDYLLKLSAKQVKIGHKIDVVTWNKKKMANEIYAGAVTIHRLPGVNFSVKGIVEDFPYLPSLPSKIESLRPDIVHAESHLFLTSLQAIIKAKKLGIPSVVTVHGAMARRNTAVDYAQYVYLYTLGSTIFKNADRVICLTQSEAGRVAEIGCPNEKIRIVPNAVNTQSFKPCHENRHDLIVWTGRFVPEKGLAYLIKAAKLVVEKRKTVRFLLVGHGPLKERIKKLANDYGLLGKYVNVTGPVRRADLPAILCKASLFVFPSLSEGLPISVLEAMSCSLPIVCTNIAALKEIVTDNVNGILVPPRDSIGLSKAMLTLLSADDLRKTMGQNSRRRAVSNYSWKLVVSMLERVYSEIG